MARRAIACRARWRDDMRTTIWSARVRGLIFPAGVIARAYAEPRRYAAVAFPALRSCSGPAEPPAVPEPNGDLRLAGWTSAGARRGRAGGGGLLGAYHHS